MYVDFKNGTCMSSASESEGGTAGEASDLPVINGFSLDALASSHSQKKCKW